MRETDRCPARNYDGGGHVWKFMLHIVNPGGYLFHCVYCLEFREMKGP